ncbi:hypothetical protein QQF64_026109, partial [Cirrhinus molitorella]
ISGVDDVHVFISSGENVRLPCYNALHDCKSTTIWTYNRFRHSSAVELIYLGIKKKDTESHERLSLGSDCSLNIKNITKEDYGLYICQQYVNEQLQGADSHVYLHVLHVSSSSSQTEISAGSSVSLSCQLYSYSSAGGSCDDWIRYEGIDLLWVNQAGDKLKISDSRYQISAPGHCIITLTTTLLNEDDNREWRCEVTHRNQLKTSATYTVKISAQDKTTTAVNPVHITKSQDHKTKGISGVNDAHVFISSGENISLPCNNALHDCRSTTWYYNRISNSSAVELINSGIKKKDTESHERLSLGSDCSLNIKNITKEDYGYYICQQYVNGQQPRTDARVYLHVLHVSSSSSQTEISAGSSVSLSCQLFSYSSAGVSCGDSGRSQGIDLLWVNQAGDKLKISDSRYQISAPGHCIITLTTTLLNEDDNREWRCEVTQGDQVKTSATYTVKISGISGVDDVHVFISSGENVRLPCNNALHDCRSTTWIYYNRFSHSAAVELIALGIKRKDTESHERLSLGSDCSLNIKNITKEDSGSYSCRQYVNGQLQGDGARVYLHVLHVSSSSSQTEISAGSSVSLSCQLYSLYGVSCGDYSGHSQGTDLLWVNQAGDKLKISDSRYQISAPGHCIITLTTTLLNEDDNREWRCEVTQGDQVKTSVTYTVKISDKTTTAVNPIAGSLFRVIVIIVEFAVFAAPTVILLQIICVRRA